jgi:hypothetical protein
MLPFGHLRVVGKPMSLLCARRGTQWLTVEDLQAHLSWSVRPRATSHLRAPIFQEKFKLDTTRI